MDHLGVDKGEKLYRLKLKEVLSLFFPISKQTPDFNATTKQNEPKKKKNGDQIDYTTLPYPNTRHTQQEHILHKIFILKNKKEKNPLLTDTPTKRTT